MNKNMAALLTGISLTALLAGGCASNEAVKSEEPVVPAATATATKAAKPEQQPATPAAADRSAADRAAAEKAAAERAAAEKAAAEKAAAERAAAERARAEQESRSAKASAAALSFETVYFDFDKSDLRQDARDVLTKNAETILKSNSGAKLQIEGHCDERGSAEYNLALGERRAKSALQYLITLGVKAENLSTISYGKEKPAVQGNDEAAWAKNRRAEFVVAK